MGNLSNFDPFGSRGRFGSIGEAFEDWFGRVMRPRFDLPEGVQAISVDVKETEGAYNVKADVPGVKKENISVAIDGNVVSIGAEVKRESQEKKGETVLREERYYGSMQRTFALPGDVDPGRAEAKYADGVLELTLPKKAGSQAKRLEIR